MDRERPIAEHATIDRSDPRRVDVTAPPLKKAPPGPPRGYEGTPDADAETGEVTAEQHPRTSILRHRLAILRSAPDAARRPARRAIDRIVGIRGRRQHAGPASEFPFSCISAALRAVVTPAQRRTEVRSRAL
jgi:hypothetical protein